MSTSRSVDRLTYTYYTGQDGSEPNGPNCHKCMNELFHENKLTDVQTVFISSPSGLIPFTTRGLVCSYGMETPFSMTLFTEDFLIARCVQCAEKAIRLELTKALKAHKEGAAKETERKRTIETRCLLETMLETSSASEAKRCRPQCENDSHGSMMKIMDKTKKEEGELEDHEALPSAVNLRPGSEDSHDSHDNLPFLYGRNSDEVNDPMSMDQIPSIAQFWKNTGEVRVMLLARSYFINQEIVICNYCNLLFHSGQGFQLIQHLLGQGHLSNVARDGSVFSNSKDLERFLLLPIQMRTESLVNNDRIPFVTESRSTVGRIRFERLFNYVKFLKRNKLLDYNFLRYMLCIYPSIKDINKCDLCGTIVFCERTALSYFYHFLSSEHIVKAIANKWNIGSDFVKFISHFSKYMKKAGPPESLSNLLNQLMVAANDKTYSKDKQFQKYKHLFEMNV